MVLLVQCVFFYFEGFLSFTWTKIFSFPAVTEDETSLISYFKMYTWVSGSCCCFLAWSMFPESMSIPLCRGGGALLSALICEPRDDFLYPKEKWIVSSVFLLSSWLSGRRRKKKKKTSLGEAGINWIFLYCAFTSLNYLLKKRWICLIKNRLFSPSLTETFTYLEKDIVRKNIYSSLTIIVTMNPLVLDGNLLESTTIIKNFITA